MAMRQREGARLMFGVWIFSGAWSLDLGSWCLEFIWILDFGFWISDLGFCFPHHST
jgi:hypothetical protein